MKRRHNKNTKTFYLKVDIHYKVIKIANENNLNEIVVHISEKKGFP